MLTTPSPEIVTQDWSWCFSEHGKGLDVMSACCLEEVKNISSSHRELVGEADEDNEYQGSSEGCQPWYPFLEMTYLGLRPAGPGAWRKGPAIVKGHVPWRVPKTVANVGDEGRKRNRIGLSPLWEVLESFIGQDLCYHSKVIIYFSIL